MTNPNDATRARIIIADDDAENAANVEQALKADGYHTKVVHDGEAALHLVRSWDPHVVLLDVNMPKVGGGGGSGEDSRAGNQELYLGVAGHGKRQPRRDRRWAR